MARIEQPAYFVPPQAAFPTWYEWSIHTSWRVYARAVRIAARAKPSAEFARDGFVIGTLPVDVVQACVAMIRLAPQIVMRGEDSVPGFRRSEKVYKVAKTLNAGHRYFLPSREKMEPLARLLETLGPPVRQALGTEWRVINTRILETLPSAEAMGPNAWHGDGFPPEILKVMIYLSPAGRDSGTTELKLGDGVSKVVEGPPGTWLLFHNSAIVHRGIPPATSPRLAIEVTLAPAWRSRLAPLFAGLNATYPEYPWSLNPLWRTAARVLGRQPDRSSPAVAQPAAVASTPDAAAPALDKAARAALKETRAAEKAAQAAEKEARAAKALRTRRRQQRIVAAVNHFLPVRAVNIGGGSEFAHAGWLNLDGAPGPANPRPFRFDEHCRFPLRDRSVRTVYSSHCLEHLDDRTVARVLAEARRVIADGGRLVIKIPDFDRALASWRSGDLRFFDPDRWGLKSLVPMWTRRGVADTLDARAAMVFCGFWNDEYGDHFSNRKGEAGAYHGPPLLGADDLRRLASTATPHEVAAGLREHVSRHEPSYHFNHQNAWSRDELQTLLQHAGFTVQSFEAEAVIAAAADIPGIEAARAESLYCLAGVSRS